MNQLVDTEIHLALHINIRYALVKYLIVYFFFVSNSISIVYTHVYMYAYIYICLCFSPFPCKNVFLMQADMYERLDQASVLRHEQMLKVQSLQSNPLDGGSR